MAPESLRDGIFSEKSDVVSETNQTNNHIVILSLYKTPLERLCIFFLNCTRIHVITHTNTYGTLIICAHHWQWSFGITCWEVFSAGRIPYPAVDAMSMLTLLESGTRLENPANVACAPEK